MTIPSRIKTIVLAGGVSPEHDISLESAKNVVRHLDPSRYETYPAIITKDGKWLLSEKAVTGSTKENFEYNEFFNAPEGSVKTDSGLFIHSIIKLKPHIVFIMMHGPGGEDGKIQGLLELTSIPFTGPGSTACAAAMDKLITKLIIQQLGFKTPEYRTIYRHEWASQKTKIMDDIEKKLSFPVFIKPNDLGSSYGVAIGDNRTRSEEIIENSLSDNKLLIVERLITGIELTVPIIGNSSDGSSYALPVIMIVPKKTRFFDLKAKYDNTITDEIVPAPIEQSIAERCQQEALKIYNTLGCDGMSRVDLIWENDTPFFLEVNPIPGFTSVSLYPKSAAAAGMTYPQLLNKLVEYSLNKFGRHNLTPAR